MTPAEMWQRGKDREARFKASRQKPKSLKVSRRLPNFKSPYEHVLDTSYSQWTAADSVRITAETDRRVSNYLAAHPDKLARAELCERKRELRDECDNV